MENGNQRTALPWYAKIVLGVICTVGFLLALGGIFTYFDIRLGDEVSFENVAPHALSVKAEVQEKSWDFVLQAGEQRAVRFKPDGDAHMDLIVRSGNTESTASIGYFTNGMTTSYKVVLDGKNIIVR